MNASMQPRGMTFFRPPMAVQQTNLRFAVPNRRAAASLSGLGGFPDMFRLSAEPAAETPAANQSAVQGGGGGGGGAGDGVMNFWGSIIGAVGQATGGVANAFAAKDIAAGQASQAEANVQMAQLRLQQEQVQADSTKNTVMMVVGAVLVLGLGIVAVKAL